MTMQQLLYALTIAGEGSINKAAESLFVSQPTLTSAVKELENELGFQIFIRSNKGVTTTNDGLDFLSNARQLYQQYELLLERYDTRIPRKKRFGVSTQHYSFAVKAFVETVKRFDSSEYEFSIQETRTREVISDVAELRSEVGILYVNEYNRKILEKLFTLKNLEFQSLIDCSAYVYLWKHHPLADRRVIRFEDLEPYPCLSFEQGDGSSFYYAEEILSTADYPRTIKATDRATMLNLMIGLNGYTLCSGVISEELNGSDYIAVPFEAGDSAVGKRMEIGYITKKNLILSGMAQHYVQELDRYLRQYQETHKGEET